MSIGLQSCVDPIGLDSCRKFSIAEEQVLRGDVVGQNAREVLKHQVKKDLVGQVEWFRWNL